MNAGPLRLPVALPRVSRTERDRVVAGICAGVGEALAVDPTLVRLTFGFLAFASGAGIVAYLGAWALLPAPGAATPPRGRRIAGTVLLAWSAILALRGLGLADSLVWPLALVAAGVAVGTGAASLGLGVRRAQAVARSGRGLSGVAASAEWQTRRRSARLPGPRRGRKIRTPTQTLCRW